MPECSSKKINNMFLIGAGFTKAVFPKAPLNNDLLEKLIKYCKNKDIPTPLKKYKQEYKTDDIEIILTKLDLEIAGSRQNNTKSIEDDRKTIERQIAAYFIPLVFDEWGFIKNKWLRDFAKLFSNNDAIVSLNYDCFLEGLLDYSELWDPMGYVNIANPQFKPEPPNPKNMVIGGCSLRPEDNFVWLIITSFIKKELPTTKNLIIIDPDANNIKDRVESYCVGSTQHLNIYPIPKTFQNGTEELLEKLNNCERKK